MVLKRSWIKVLILLLNHGGSRTNSHFKQFARALLSFTFYVKLNATKAKCRFLLAQKFIIFQLERPMHVITTKEECRQQTSLCKTCCGQV